MLNKAEKRFKVIDHFIMVIDHFEVNDRQRSHFNPLDSSHPKRGKNARNKREETFS